MGFFGWLNNWPFIRLLTLPLAIIYLLAVAFGFAILIALMFAFPLFGIIFGAVIVTGVVLGILSVWQDRRDAKMEEELQDMTRGRR